MSTYKKALDAFASQMNKGLAQYEKDFIRVKQDTLVDSMSTTMVNVKMCLDELNRAVQERSDIV